MLIKHEMLKDAGVITHFGPSIAGAKGEPGLSVADKGLPGPRGEDGEPGLPGSPGRQLLPFHC